MVTLRNDLVMLRPWQIEDAPWYVKARDEEIYRWTTERRTLTVEETEAAIRQVNAGDPITSFAIVAIDSGHLVGNIALARDEHVRSSGEVMYWLAAAGRGRGIATAAVELICRWAFAELDLAQITLQTHADNARSQHVAERTGFKRMRDANTSEQQADRVWFIRHSEWAPSSAV
jgi:RimJ/RimL family protein N-acetyltransferase